MSIDLKDMKDMDGLTEDQINLIKKEFDYLLYLSYIKSDLSNPSHIKMVEDYMQSDYVKIAAMIEFFKKRNELAEAGILGGKDDKPELEQMSLF